MLLMSYIVKRSLSIMFIGINKPHLLISVAERLPLHYAQDSKPADHADAYMGQDHISAYIHRQISNNTPCCRTSNVD